MVHQWRAHEDAILVGRNTVENDNPKLTVRKVKGINPVRVILDPNLKLGSDHNIFDNSSKTIIANLVLEEKNWLVPENRVAAHLFSIKYRDLIFKDGKVRVVCYEKKNGNDLLQVVINQNEFVDFLVSIANKID